LKAKDISTATATATATKQVEAKREKATGKRWSEKNGLIADEVGSVFSYPPPPAPTIGLFY
jgi:hypothetical protein